MDEKALIQGVIFAVVFGVLGICLFALAIKVMQKVASFSIEKEIAEDQNVALGIVMGAILLGLAIILAAAIH
jgi:putative membrane protein